MNKTFDPSSNEISLDEIFQQIKIGYSYVKTQWIKIIFIGFSFGLLGFIYASFQDINYTAKITFVVEEGKNSSSGLGGLASLAGQFGVDVGGSNSGSVLSGDNILLYFKSESLAREVLLSKFDSSSSNSLADKYSEVYGLQKSWRKNRSIGKISFQILRESVVYSRLQDSLLQRIIGAILTNQFSVSKTDKKSGFVEVNTTMKDEMLAKIYCERIVEVAVAKYINLKTQRQKATVEKLQFRSDSISAILSKKTFTSALLQTSNSTMDVNPLYKTATTVAFESTTRDKTMLATIFSSVVQNLEVAKFTLSQETPVIQIIDFPLLPLKVKQESKKYSALLFSIIGVFSFLFFLFVKNKFSKTE